MTSSNTAAETDASGLACRESRRRKVGRGAPVSLLSVSQNVRRGPAALALLSLAAAALALVALAGLAYVAGFDDVAARFDRVDWEWLLVSLAGMIAAFAGYRFAYEGVSCLEGGRRMSHRERSALVAVGFGGFVARGGSGVDRYGFETAGGDAREAKVRVAGLDSLEHVPIAVGSCAAAIVLLAEGTQRHPPLDFLWPWATIPPLGGVIAVWAAHRYRERWRDASGWRGPIGIGLDGVWMLIDLARRRPAHGLPYAGMCLFWAGDLLALWAALASFGFHMGVAQLIIAYAIGYALTRRSAPLGGAGLIETFLPLTLWDSGAPLPAAVAGVLTYRVFNLWLPLPLALASLPRLRAMGERSNPTSSS
jgi:uncharacterized membrane protein YbhN (UPF0104 family)